MTKLSEKRVVSRFTDQQEKQLVHFLTQKREVHGLTLVVLERYIYVLTDEGRIELERDLGFTRFNSRTHNKVENETSRVRCLLTTKLGQQVVRLFFSQGAWRKSDKQTHINLIPKGRYAHQVGKKKRVEL